jgi:hypothetical protein
MHARRRSNKYQYHSLLFDFTKVQTMIYHTQEQHVNHNGYRHGQNKLKVYVIIDYLFKNSVVDHGLNFGKVKQQTMILVFVTSTPCMHY